LLSKSYVIDKFTSGAARGGAKGHHWKGAELHKEQTEAFSQD
jgi:hypothetical protein